MPLNISPAREFYLGPLLPKELGVLLSSISDKRQDEVHRHSVHHLVSYLEELIQSPVEGIILYGTSVSKDDNKNEIAIDKDALILCREKITGGIWGYTNQLNLDIYIAPIQVIHEGKERDWSHISQGIVLFDTQGHRLINWVNDLRMWKAKHTIPWSDAERVRDLVWAYRLLERVFLLRESDPLQASVQEALLVSSFSSLYAGSLGRHSTSLTKWIRYISRSDRTFYIALNEYLKNRSFPPNGKKLKELLDMLFQPYFDEIGVKIDVSEEGMFSVFTL